MKKALGLISLMMPGIALAAPTNEELQQQIEELRAQLEATASAVESAQVDSNPVTLGGYGEMHLNRNLESGADDVIDFHRYVLFVGKQLGEKTYFFSEFELEHSLAGEGKPGEVELEQAFIEHEITQNVSFKTGLFLVPVGILNETHEPDTFYGVERNNVEKNIIPTTWWEGGAGFSGQYDALSFDVAAHSGLFINVLATDDAGDANPEYKMRSGRQKVAEAKANKLAYTARVNYSVMPGVSVGGALQYQEDVTQGIADIDAQLIEAHATVEQNGFGLRALYAQWMINEKIEDFKSGAKEQKGYYIEPSYRINESVGVFARYSFWDNLASDSDDSDFKQTDIGVNYWLAETAVLKADFAQQEDAAGDTSDVINLGVGYSF